MSGAWRPLRLQGTYGVRRNAEAVLPGRWLLSFCEDADSTRVKCQQLLARDSLRSLDFDSSVWASNTFDATPIRVYRESLCVRLIARHDDSGQTKATPGHEDD
jgi:hypothetical protein